MLQTTLIQLDNYGPWTVTPEPQPEMKLQRLQSRLYADLAEWVGTRDGYVFYLRGDNMVGVTNGIARSEHAEIQAAIANQYPVTASVAIGTGSTPAHALSEATKQLQTAGSAQNPDRQSVLRGDALASPDNSQVHVAHFDVNDVTSCYTDQLSAFETYVTIERGYAELMQYMYRTNDALSFFVGGDNVIAICPDLTPAQYRDALDYVRETAELDLKVGVGSGTTARAAGMAAKHALESCRDRDKAVTQLNADGVQPPPGD